MHVHVGVTQFIARNLLLSVKTNLKKRQLMCLISIFWQVFNSDKWYLTTKLKIFIDVWTGERPLKCLTMGSVIILDHRRYEQLNKPDKIDRLIWSFLELKKRSNTGRLWNVDFSILNYFAVLAWSHRLRQKYLIRHPGRGEAFIHKTVTQCVYGDVCWT